jgi:cytidine deaminase
MSKSADPLAELFAAAKAAQANAYAPYSRFRVGAALRAPDGAIYSGGNVENASYPEGVCAETSAIAAMVAAGARRIAEICVIGDGEGLCTPCGGCRQRIREFADDRTIIHVAGPEGVRATFRLAALLPESFGPGHLPPISGRSGAES